MIIVYLCIFFLGASIASFLNATLYRIEKKYKYPEILNRPSHCEKCKHKLSWWELFPILGYLFIKGKCIKCNNKVNIYYPVSELILGITTLLFYLNNMEWYIWIIVTILFILSYHDILYHAIPRNITHILLIFCSLIFIFLISDSQNLILPISISVMFLIINIFKKSFGMGDILVLLSLGILLPYTQYLVLFWSSIFTALLYSLIWILVKKKDVKKAKVPMLPFITISFLITILYGETIYTTLLNLLGI